MAPPPRSRAAHERGAAEWFPCGTVDTALLSTAPARFARGVGAGEDKTVILALDNAGGHAGEALAAVPPGVRPVFLPPDSPELQPAEHPWPLTDEAIADKSFAPLAELDRVLAARGLALSRRPDTIKAHTHFAWWPQHG